MSKTHDLKCWPEYFQAIKRGEKTFEIRKDDRSFRVGDTLRLAEWDLTTGEYTGEEIALEVTYRMHGGKFGVEEGHCILGFKSPQMAAEIKRLEAALQNEVKAHGVTQFMSDAVVQVNEQLRARIALLESALGLPEGCDVFQIERAMKEGARDEHGRIWTYHGDTGGLHGYRFDRSPNHWCLVNKDGREYHKTNPQHNTRLYCIKEAKK